MQVTITTSASVDDAGQVRALTSSEVIEAASVVNGSQDIGNTYEPIAQAQTSTYGCIIYNTGAVDVSIRATLLDFTTNEYIFYNVIPGGIIFVPFLVDNDAGAVTKVQLIDARTASGTATLEYCLIL
jgi:hypothetical protein